MFNTRTLIPVLLLLLLASSVAADAAMAQTAPAQQPYFGKVRIKELSTIEGLDSVTVSAPGLVVGLNGTGDSVSRTNELLARYNITLPANVKSGGSAIVMVSATIGPFMTFGDKANVEVSILGDAKSLENGRLLSTPLYSPLNSGIQTKDTYVLAEGPVGQAEDANSPVNGHVHEGGVVVRDLKTSFHRRDHFILVLRDADFKTAHNIIRALNDEAPRLFAERVGDESFSADAFTAHAVAEAIDAKRVLVKIPEKHRDDVVSFISRVQDIEVDADLEGTVTINLKTKNILFTNSVYVLPTTIMYKNTTINTTQNTAAATKPYGEIGKSGVQKQVPAPLQNLTADLGANGWTTDDIINIVMELHRAGAIKARLIVN